MSTASMGSVKRSSSQPYAFGVSLMTVCLYSKIRPQQHVEWSVSEIRLTMRSKWGRTAES